MRRVVLCAGFLVWFCGCEKSRPLEHVNPSLLAIGTQVTVRTDTIGMDEHETTATFAIVDADNKGDRAARVTLGGVLVDADGQEVGRLRTETLWIPPRGRRTYALVDDREAARPTATTARIDVRGAVHPRHDEPVKIEQGHVWKDGDRVVATAMVVNTADRPCTAVVLAGFHDRDGRPLQRPFSIFPIGGKIERPARFVGPSGSTTGYIFVGKVRC